MQDRKPLVSVIMPSLNVVKYIDECIQSVLNQSLKEIEIICVDAGSTDGTYERLKEYETNDSRVRVILSDKRSYGLAIWDSPIFTLPSSSCVRKSNSRPNVLMTISGFKVFSQYSSFFLYRCIRVK